MRQQERMRRSVVGRGRYLIPVHLRCTFRNTQNRAHGAKQVLWVVAPIAHLREISESLGALLQSMHCVFLHLLASEIAVSPVLHQVAIEGKVGDCTVPAA